MASSRRTPSRSRNPRACAQVVAPVASREPSRPARSATPPPRRTPRPRSGALAGSRGRAAPRGRPARTPRRADRRTHLRRAPSPGASRCTGTGSPDVSVRIRSRARTSPPRIPPAIPFPSGSTRSPAHPPARRTTHPLALGARERLPEVPAAPRAPRPIGAIVRHMSSKSSGILAPMEFQDVVRRRRMIRDYADEPVDPAFVDRALANAVRAPSAGFSQGWAFLRARPAGRHRAVLGRRPRRPGEQPDELAARHDDARRW